MSMRTRSKLLLATLTVAVMLASAVATASAGRLSVSEARFRITWSSLELSGFATNVRCALTLEGSYHSRTSAKTAEALAGYITGATVRHPCTGGEAWAFNGTENLEGTTLANSLPWHIRYESFSGTLPNITEITDKLVGARFLIKATFLGITIRCVYTTTATEPAHGPTRRDITSRTLTSHRAEGSIRSETGGCPTGTFSGEGPITTPAGARITVTLI
ncbi:MAG: hypothetical protein JSS99_01570 [Actinobacteria bacterium]|nr:hypothetical protein [Actinomycetota bacterium]